jgi:hypothetical protein
MKQIIAALLLFVSMTALMPYDEKAIQGVAASTFFYYDNCDRADVSRYAMAGAKLYYPTQVQAEYTKTENVMKNSGLSKEFATKMWCSMMRKSVLDIR